jgi:hypothetical protein
MSEENGKDTRHRDRLLPFGAPEWDALDRETKWELVGCAVLLVVIVSMAAAINLYVP